MALKPKKAIPLAVTKRNFEVRVGKLDATRLDFPGEPHWEWIAGFPHYKNKNKHEDNRKINLPAYQAVAMTIVALQLDV